jgi:hypothetical protein
MDMGAAAQKIRPRLKKDSTVTMRPQNPEGLWSEEVGVLWAGSLRFRAKLATNRLLVGHTVALHWTVVGDARYEAVAEVESIEEGLFTFCFNGTGFRYQSRQNVRVDVGGSTMRFMTKTKSQSDNPKLLNLSCSGCLMRLEQKINVGDILIGSLKLGDDILQDVALRCMRLVLESDKSCDAAFHYVALPERESARVAQWVLKHGRKARTVVD